MIYPPPDNFLNLLYHIKTRVSIMCATHPNPEFFGIIYPGFSRDP